ncbi:MAG: putative quinol monooxygenase [Pseudomonadota bacterium]
MDGKELDSDDRFLITPLAKIREGYPMAMVHVIAIITTKDGLREKVLEEFRKIIPLVLAEDGCLEYGPAIDADRVGEVQTEFGNNTFVVVEKWESAAALRAHFKAPHMAEYASKVRDMLADRAIHVLSPA